MTSDEFVCLVAAFRLSREARRIDGGRGSTLMARFPGLVVLDDPIDDLILLAREVERVQSELPPPPNLYFVHADPP